MFGEINHFYDFRASYVVLFFMVEANCSDNEPSGLVTGKDAFIIF